MPSQTDISQWWIDNAGVTPQAANAIARSAMVESGGNPNAFNPAGGGQGAYGTMQWRGPRLTALKEQPNYGDWRVQQQFALSEFQGGDKQAASAWNKIKTATDESSAYRLVRDNFGRGEDSTGYREGYGVGEPRHGGTYLGVVHPRVEGENLSVEGALLLSNLLEQQRQRQEAAQQDTGNKLLNSILQQSVSAPASQPQQQPLDTTALRRATPQPQLPQTVPELATAQVPTAPLQQITQPTPPVTPAAASQPRPSQPVPPVPQRPVIQPTGRPVEASMFPDFSGIDWSKLGRTGNALLDAILKVGPKVGAMETPLGAAAMLPRFLGGSRQQPAPPSPAGTPMPASAPSAPAQADTPLDRMMAGIGVVPSAKTDIEQAEAEQKAAQQPPQPLLAVGDGAELTGRIPELAEAIVPYIAGGAPGEGAVTSAGMRVPPRFEGNRIIVPREGEPAAGTPRIEGNKIIVPKPGEGGGKPPSGSAEMPPPAKLPPPPKVTYQELDDDLFKLQQRGQAKMLEAQKIVEELRDRGVDMNASRRAYHTRESRLTRRPEPEAPQFKYIEKVLAPFDDKALQDAQWIYQHAPDIYQSMSEKPLRTVAEGHVHRKVIGYQRPGEMLDPEPGDILTRTFLGGGGLSRRASGLMHREPHYLWENNQGQTLSKWGRLGEKGGPAKYGETFTDQNGVRWTAREPTTRELEARFPNRRYVDDLVANAIDNGLRLDRVRNNIEVLEKWKPRLEAEGLWFPEGSHANVPAKYLKDGKIEVPGLRGHADPMVASIVNDMFRKGGAEWQRYLDNINRVMVGSMFWLPIRHQLNVGAHYAVGRGFDWLYRNPNLLRAATEVATLGPNYIRYLKEGAGLRYASTLNENFYNTLLTKLGHDIVKDPEWEGIAKALGFNGAQHLAEKVYGASRRSLWKVNDIFLTARIMELERAGKPLKEAIRIAEEEIPNYRLPTTNLMLRRVINSPVIAFGRYGYGRATALAKTVHNLVGPNVTGEARLRALAQALILTVAGTTGYTIANHALQSLQTRLMSAFGDRRGKQILGNKPLEFAEYGPFGVVRETGRYGLSWLPKSVQQARVPLVNERLGALVGLEPEAEDWSKLLSSMITAAPGLEMLGTILAGGRNLFTGQKVVNPQGHLPAQAVQALEWLGRGFSPLGTALDMAKRGVVPGLGPPLGLHQHYAPPGRVVRREKRGAAREEALDPLQRGADRLFGLH